MRYLTLGEIIILYQKIMQQSGGITGIANIRALESALAQPRQTFANKELYPSIIDKAAALSFFLIQNHPFVDGNKRTGHAAMEIFLFLNDYALDASVAEQETIILQIASGQLSGEDVRTWLSLHTVLKE